MNNKQRKWGLSLPLSSFKIQTQGKQERQWQEAVGSDIVLSFWGASMPATVIWRPERQGNIQSDRCPLRASSHSLGGHPQVPSPDHCLSGKFRAS